MALRKPKLLAPAGSMESLRAAVYAGADAVYFGGGSFNARAFATNFGTDDMAAAFRLCRLYGVEVYITLNTLLLDKEIDMALKFVEQLEENYKPNAYIVQDLGLINALNKQFPGIPLHASTQMQLHSSLCAPMLKKLGITRVVLARELSKQDIAAVAKCGLETEIFVHGAICVSQSGGCLMSSCIGGRSGNRGKCAQPCRQSYGGKYPLSLKDMCLAEHIPEICAMGVDCLKIEGRMKAPEYVYETVKVYRGLIDACRSATKEELSRLSAAFSRSGFTDGYYTGRKGTEMFGVRTQADKDKSRALDVTVKETKLPITIKCVLKEGQNAYIKARYKGIVAEHWGDLPQNAINRPITADELKTRLGKTGDTPFYAEDISVDMEGNLIMPVSAINALRRNVLDKLSKLIIETNTPDRGEGNAPIEYTNEQISVGKPKLIARFEGSAPIKQVLEKALEQCDRVELPLDTELPDTKHINKISLVLPRAVYDSDTDRVKELLQKAYSHGVRSLTVPNLGMLPLCGGFNLHGDYPLNVTNTHTAAVLKKLGFGGFTVSPEIKPGVIARKVNGAEYIVYGRTPLMYTENCIIRNIGQCKNQKRCYGTLKDKTGASFPIIREYGHRNIIYNSVPTYLIDKKTELGAVSGHVLFFTSESGEEILRVLDSYAKQAAPKDAFTRGAFKRDTGVF